MDLDNARGIRPRGESSVNDRRSRGLKPARDPSCFEPRLPELPDPQKKPARPVTAAPAKRLSIQPAPGQASFHATPLCWQTFTPPITGDPPAAVPDDPLPL